MTKTGWCLDEAQAKKVFPGEKGEALAEHRHNLCRNPDECACPEHEMDFLR